MASRLHVYVVVIGVSILLCWHCAPAAADTEDRRITIHPEQPRGVVNTLLEALPDGEPTCCEHEWTVRLTHYHPAAIVPRRMYFSSCNTDETNPTMFASLSLGENRRHPEADPSTGAIIRSELNPSTGALEVKGMRRFEECIWMEGIATSSDCQTIGALCRRRFGDSDFDKDSLATHSATDWMTQEECADHEMWLYEWTDGDIQSEPRKYVLHRALGYDWEYGNNYLRYAEEQNVYGIGIKARVFGGGTCHEADAFLVLDRDNYDFTDRGYSWACGFGHTIFNRPVFNPDSGKFG